jgi:hypothetical protein
MSIEHSLYVRAHHGDSLDRLSSGAQRRGVCVRYLGLVDALGRTDALLFGADRLLRFTTFFFTFVEPVATRLE